MRPLPLLPNEILSGLGHTKRAGNVPSQTCMMHNDWSDLVPDWQLLNISGIRTRKYQIRTTKALATPLQAARSPVFSRAEVNILFTGS